jgi:polyisoprenoid-binding protein YceI
MKKLFQSVVVVAAVALPSLALASTWEIDPAHSSANFTVKHMMVSNVHGKFDKVAGTINLDDKDITKSSVEAVIDVSSVDTDQPQRDAHLKTSDFFSLAQYPTITFKSKKVEKAGEGKLKVTGDLTMRGVTKEVVLDVDGPTQGFKNPMDGSLRSGASATTELNRKDYGVNWNKPLEAAGGVVVGDNVKIEIDLELVKKDTAATPKAAQAKDTK